MQLVFSEENISEDKPYGMYYSRGTYNSGHPVARTKGLAMGDTNSVLMKVLRASEKRMVKSRLHPKVKSADAMSRYSSRVYSEDVCLQLLRSTCSDWSRQTICAYIVAS
jgi:hypothetical protein